MTKAQSESIRIGTKCWSRATGLGVTHQVTEIRNTGPRKPYFTLRGVSISYRDVTTTGHVSLTMTREQRRARKRELWAQQHEGRQDV